MRAKKGINITVKGRELRMPTSTTIEFVDVSYEGAKNHTVSVQGVNDEYVELVIWGEDGTRSATMTPDQLMQLALTAKEEVHQW